MHPGNQDGSYLVREAKNPGHYALSVRLGDAVKHYHILQRDGEGFYIHRKRVFQKLADLVAHYKEADGRGLCVQLKKSCVRS